MVAQWTAELIGEMHLNGITKRMLATELNVTPEYVSMILNGHRHPKNAEKTFKDALRRLIGQRTKITTSEAQ